MLLYFYLLCLLVCIRFTFCYEYISDQERYNPKRARKDDRLRLRKVKENGRKLIKRHYYDTAAAQERDPVAEIDVASFIGKPDYDAIDENGPYMPLYKKRERVSKEYNDYGSIPGINLDGNVEKQSQDYLYQGINSLNDKQYLYKNMINPYHSDTNSFLEGMEKKNDNMEEMSKSSPNEFLIDKIRTHKPVKKCPLKQMKIPFFSRKKTGTTKAKKLKKRRLFGFNFGNKTKEAITSSTPAIDPTMNVNKNAYKIRKRSYNEKICPICRRKFTTQKEKLNTRKRRTSSRMIHNSRQFYQELSSSKYEPKKEIPLNNVNYNADEDNDKIEERRKRDTIDDTIDDRERQLKELDEVQKKIDNVDTNSIRNSKDDSNLS